MRLIDADALIDYLQMMPIDLGYREVEDIEKYVKEMTAIEPEKICVAKITLTDDQVTEAVEKAMNEVLSSIEPERKTGRWIWNKNGMDWGLGAWTCSECKQKPETWWESDERYNPLKCSGSQYCGNCGAVMRGKHDKNR